MKRCPQCRRDYYNETLLYCLDDGAPLLDGPATVDEPATISLPTETQVRPGTIDEPATKTFPTDIRTSGGGTANWRTVIACVLGLFLVAALAAGSYFYFFRGGTGQIGSIAVMPFVDQTGNPDVEYLSDGITESLITSLSQLKGVSVKARSSVFTYKGRGVTPQQVGKELAVAAVLNGRVSQRGEQMVLSLELVDTANGNRLWGEQYSRNTADLVKLQGEIAQDVSAKLKAKLTGAEQQSVSKHYTENAEAYSLYLRGRHHWNKRKSDELKKSVEYFQQAIDRDPTYALAYASLAETYIILPAYGVSSSADSYPKARAAALKAIEIDPSLAEAHNALGSVLEGYDWRFAAAEAEWRKATELNPNYATAHQFYAEHLLNMGRLKEALTEIRRAQELDPLSLIINAIMGLTLGANGDNEAAFDQLRKTLELDPSFPRTHIFLSGVYDSMGRYEEAVDEFAKAVVLNGAPAERIAPLASAVKNAARQHGERGYARAMAEALETNASSSNPPAPVLASFWGRAGDTEKAFALLERAFAERDDSIVTLKRQGFGPIKSDPRYKDLLRRIGLPE